jgi:hypothetical protein
MVRRCKVRGKAVKGGSLAGNKRKPKPSEVSFQRIGILFDDDGEDPDEAIKNIANFIGSVCQTGNIDYFSVYRSCKLQIGKSAILALYYNVCKKDLEYLALLLAGFPYRYFGKIQLRQFITAEATLSRDDITSKLAAIRYGV